MKSDPDIHHVPKLAIIVSLYYTFILLICGGLSALTYMDLWYLKDRPKFVYAFCFGAIGGTIYASRYVANKVRHSEYEGRILLWQIWTPIWGAVLAGVGNIAWKAGILSFSEIKNPEIYDYLVMIVSFLIGHSSELFIQRLIKAAESLFGENHKTTDTK